MSDGGSTADIGQGEALGLSGLRVLDLSIAQNWLYCRFSRKKSTILPPKILVLCDGQEVGAVETSELKFWKSGTTSFTLFIPHSFNDGAPHEVALHASDTRERLSQESPFDKVVHCCSMMSQIERLGGRGATGWIHSPDLSSDDVVELYDGDRLLTVRPLSVARPDVDAAFGVSGARGFSFFPPRQIYDGRVHDLRIYWRGQRLACSTARQVVLKMKPEAMPSGLHRYEGGVTEISARGVRGHVIDLLDDAPVALEVLVDGQLITTLTADAYVPSLRSRGVSGFHGFAFAFPAALMNGQHRQVSVRVAGSDHVLPAKSDGADFPLVFCPTAPAVAQVWTPGRHLGWGAASPTGRQDVGEGTPARLSLIVLNLNGGDLLRSLLSSVLEVEFRDQIEVVIVDHGSTDNSAEVVREFTDKLDIRAAFRGANHSFSASNNYGASIASGDYLVFCNNDIVFTGDCLSRMRAALQADPELGLAGAKLLEPVYRGAGQWALRYHHTGVGLDVGRAAHPRRPQIYYPVELTDQSERRDGVVERVAVTAALAMMRTSDFMAIEGFDEGYNYGYEDVDLALRLRQQLALKTACVLDADAIHNRSATRERKIDTVKDKAASLYNDRTARANRMLFYRRFSRFLPRQVMSQLVAGLDAGRPSPLRVVFAVSETHMDAAAGDYFTAMELALAMRREFGWEVMFVHHKQFDVDGADLLVVMRHDYDLGRIQNANPGLLAVAWIRNRVDQWIDSPHFEKYHVLFASSKKAIDTIAAATGREAALLPIASNVERFGAGRPKPELGADVVFTGHYWGAQREAVDVLDPRKVPYGFSIWGKKWDEHPIWSRFWRGWAPYYDLPDIYASSKLVIDDSHPVTRDWNSLNSRVFDVLASGRLVLTNCTGGAQELFGDRLPTFSSQDELRSLIRRFLEDPDERERLAAELQAEVREHHSYRRRALTFRDVVGGYLGRDGLRIAIKSPAPNHETKHQWGDHHFALALKRALERLGHTVRIDILPEWYSGVTAADEAVIVLRGLSRYEPSPTSINLMWLISHPDDVSLAEMREYDHVFVASAPLAERLKPRLGERVSPLLQCTDPELFRPATESVGHRVLFVGNSRAQFRPMVRWALDRGVGELALFGSGWAGLVPDEYLKGEHIRNEDLHRYYSGAGVLLNDHWPDMAAEGFISNRLFDAAACGATIVSDPVAGLSDVFGDLVYVCPNKADLTYCVDSALMAEDRAVKAERLRRLVLQHHTFDHRAQTITDVIGALTGESGWLRSRKPSRRKRAGVMTPA